MTRTFSKIHGLAGLRIGWIYAPAHVVDALNRIRGPFNVRAPRSPPASQRSTTRAHSRTRAPTTKVAGLADRGDRAGSA